MSTRKSIQYVVYFCHDDTAGDMAGKTGYFAGGYCSNRWKIAADLFGKTIIMRAIFNQIQHTDVNYSFET